MSKPYLRGGMYYSNFRAHGKRVRQALSANKRTAQTMLDEMVAANRAQKNGLIPRNVSWQTFETRYLQYCYTDKKTATIYRDKAAFRMMQDAIPVLRLHDVTPELLERLKFKWKKRGISPSTITRSIKAIKTAMRKAEEWGYIQKQEWRSVKVKEPKGRLLYYTVEELERLISVAEGIYRTTVIIMGRAGLRSGEVYHLRSEDIHFPIHKIRITEKPCAMGCPGCESGVWQPKGNKERWVPMVADLESYLRAMPRAPGFVLGHDRPILQAYLKHLQRTIRRANLNGQPHTIRHTFASHAVSNGASLEAIGEILGHSDPRTSKIYAHLMPHAFSDALARLPVVRLGYTLTSKEGKRRNGKA